MFSACQMMIMVVVVTISKQSSSSPAVQMIRKYNLSILKKI